MLRNRIKLTWPLFPLAFLYSCTAEQIYTNVQDDHIRQCRLLPVWQQEHCLSLNDTSWEDYVRESQTAATQSEVD
ncbi:MAG: hypothetical protein KJN90_12015 [Gammaproteobacteria bacterium]|nr:hypothetical protein [Gammaproteobacteria bacterium]